MLEATLQILPPIAIILIGYGLKRAKFMSSDDGSTLLKLIFYAGVPALMFVSILKVTFEPSLIWLCFVAPIIVVATSLVTYLIRRPLLTLVNIKTFGSMLIGGAIINTIFLIPFVERIYGPDGLARLAIVDAINGLMIFSVVYAIAVKLGNDDVDRAYIAKKLLISPPLWALLIALACKASGATPPSLVLDTLGTVAKLVGPVILIALGLKFTLRIKRPLLLIIPLALRFGLGTLLALIFVKIVGLTGLTADIAILSSMAPIGFTSITISELENLDTEFAVSQVSASILIALIVAPLAITLLSSFTPH